MKIETLFICEICGQKYADKDLALECESKGIPLHKYAVGNEIVMPLRYPDTDGYFGVAKVVALLISKNHKPFYELSNTIQTGKNFWSGAGKMENGLGIFGAENYYAPANESEMYRVGDKYNYTHLGVDYDTILIENCSI